jgi:hypothetical protein
MKNLYYAAIVTYDYLFVDLIRETVFNDISWLRNGFRQRWISPIGVISTRHYNTPGFNYYSRIISIALRYYAILLQFYKMPWARHYYLLLIEQLKCRPWLYTQPQQVTNTRHASIKNGWLLFRHRATISLAELQ